MTDKPRETFDKSQFSGNARRSRREVLRGMALTGGMVAGLGPVAAQDNFWDKIFNANNATRTSSADERKKPEVLNDLRPDSTPYRSEAMMDAIETAIQRYQKIADSGG